MHEALTPREAEVLQLLAQGMTYREIREGLVISERTLEGHLMNIAGKIGLDGVNHARIIIRAVEYGLVRLQHQHEWRDFRQCQSCGLVHEGDISA